MPVAHFLNYQHTTSFTIPRKPKAGSTTPRKLPENTCKPEK